MKQVPFYTMSEEWEGYFSNATEACIYGYIKTMCDNVGVCRASVSVIARKAFCKPRRAISLLRSLAERGFITFEERAGKSTLYKANPCNNCTPAKIAPLQKLQDTPAKIASPQIIINNNLNKLKINKRDTRTRAIEFVSPEYRETFEEWLQYKKERRDTYKSERALRACYNHLVNLSGNDAETAAAIVQQSIANNWAGLFALKSQNNHEQRNSKNRQYNQEVDAAILAGLLAE